MKKLFKTQSLFLCFAIIFFNSPSIFSGNFFSKLSKQAFFYHNNKKNQIEPQYEMYNDKIFNSFLKKHHAIIENEKHATLLGNSTKNELWDTLRLKGGYGNTIAEIESQIPGEYLLRVDYETRFIYTIRKIENEYFCAFYLLYPKQPIKKSIITTKKYYWTSVYIKLSKSYPIKNALLPIDKDLPN